MFGRIYLGSHLVLDFWVFLGIFLITDLISLLVIGPDFLLLPDSVLKDCIFLGIYSFLPECPICWYITVLLAYDPLYFCGVKL